jgi:hypothetical protein
MRMLLLASSVLLLAACARPMSLSSTILPSVDCNGKGVFTFQGSSVGNQNVTVVVDCSNLHLQQLQPEQFSATTEK